MTRIYVILCVVISVIIYNIIKIYLVKRKSKIIISINRLNYLTSNKYILTYTEKIKQKLHNLGYPYKLSFKSYIFIKYFLSIFIFLISIANYRSPFIPLVLLLIVFYIPNLVLKSYIKKEQVAIINELRTINSCLILYLSAYTPLKDALKYVAKSIKHKRFQEEFLNFTHSYETYEFNMKKASMQIITKFKSEELNMFFSILIQSQKDGNILENLKRFNETLEVGYFKCAKQKSSSRLVCVALGTVLMLINIALITIYPIFVQVVNNLSTIFS